MGSKNSAWNWRRLWTINYISNILLFQRKCPFDSLIVPDGEVPIGTEKINSKNLHEMFKDTKSHGLVSLQFIGALGILFGLDISVLKNAITELYKNLSYESEWCKKHWIWCRLWSDSDKKSQLYQIDKEKRRMKKVMFKGSTWFFLTSWLIWGGIVRGLV